MTSSLVGPGHAVDVITMTTAVCLQVCVLESVPQSSSHPGWVIRK